MRTLLTILAFLASAAAHALPDSVRNGDPDWRQWGSGEMSWLGFSLYRATFWVRGDAAASSPENAPSALQLDYRRDIASDRLVATSIDEMRRLGASEAQLQRWRPELQKVLPDVREGDSIVGLHHPGRSASFYHRGRQTGEVPDAEFARLFFAIWLDPRTRNPELRSALLRRPER
ncbi:MAG TPA: chalcone isomerase family protein [Candidatus Accumulibacter phosphatis]|nr:chalcone isomerase family protein [Candidatus Accumulibacter phosphatis]HRQ93866.1 chalcone isomerase family protein [Candidatus Accumulibacter phosphatis]